MSCANYNHAYREAIRKMTLHDPQLMADRSGAIYNPDLNKFTLSYCGSRYQVSFPGGEVEPLDPPDQVRMDERTLMLLYLANASGLPPRGQWLSFIELPGGPHHHGPFVREAADPLARQFGSHPEAFVAAGRALGGTSIQMGDAAILLPALPVVPLAIALWTANDEFPSRAVILFDSSAPASLDTASLYVLGISAAQRLTGWAEEKMREQ